MGAAWGCGVGLRSLSGQAPAASASRVARGTSRRCGWRSRRGSSGARAGNQACVRKRVAETVDNEHASVRQAQAEDLTRACVVAGCVIAESGVSQRRWLRPAGCCDVLLMLSFDRCRPNGCGPLPRSDARAACEDRTGSDPQPSRQTSLRSRPDRIASPTPIRTSAPEHLADRAAGHRDLVELSRLREVVGDQSLEHPSEPPTRRRPRRDMSVRPGPAGSSVTLVRPLTRCACRTRSSPVTV